MKKGTKKIVMRLLKCVLVIALFSSMIINMYSDKVVAKTYSKFSFDKLEEENKENWENYCEESYNDQGDDEVAECYENLKATLKKFYNKLYKKLAKYQKKNLEINDQVILWTIFYGQFASPNTGVDGYNQDEDANNFYEQWSNQSYGYTMDDSDDDEDVSTDVNADDIAYFQTETDTLKTLITNTLAYTTYCYGKTGDATKVTASDGTKTYTCEDSGSIAIDNPSGLGKVCVKTLATNEMGYWKMLISKNQSLKGEIAYFLGIHKNDDYYDTCMKNKESGEYIDVYYQYEDEPNVSYDAYFDFLKEGAYFDGKSNLQYFFNDVLVNANVDCLKSNICENSLESLGEEEYEKYQDDLEEDRLDIIYDILEILDELGVGIQYADYVPSSKLIEGGSPMETKAYYWPIGSDETTEENGITYATGDPASTNVISYKGTRFNDALNKIQKHYGIDIEGVEGTTNVIAVSEGTVLTVVDGCESGDYKCNDNYGNEVVIVHSNGDYSVYASLYDIDKSVVVGESIKKGQVIGHVGSTGATLVTDLHFEIRVGGSTLKDCVDPLTLISAENPRPSAVGAGDFSMRSTTLSKSEFVSGLKNYCTNNSSVCNNPKTSGGLQYFADHAETIYDVSVKNGLNPEYTVARAVGEGFSPWHTNTSVYNFWGIACYNSASLNACSKYSSLEMGVEKLANLSIVKKYDSAFEVFYKGHYAWVGDYLFSGQKYEGCAFISYMSKYYPTDADRERAEAACASTNKTPTTDADQYAYSAYIVSIMQNVRSRTWGL